MKLFPFFIISIIILSLVAGCESATERKPVTTQKTPEVNTQKTQPLQNQVTLEKQENIDPKLAQQIIAVIKENLDANEKKDKKRVLNTIHKNSPQLKSTIAGMDFIFPQYTFHFILDTIEVLQVIGDSAVVHFKQTTLPVGNQQGVSPNKSEGLHYMKKDGKNWKLFKTEFLGTDYNIVN